MLIISLVLITGLVGYVCGEWSGYRKCIKDYKDIMNKVSEKYLPLFINS